MEYLIHTGALLAGCFAYYWFVLRRETHFRLNRWVLLACLLGSLALPLLTIPAGWSLREAIVTETESAAQPPAIESYTAPAETSITNAVDDAETASVVTANEAAETTALPTSSSGQDAVFATDNFGWAAIDWLRVLWYVYLAGVLIFAGNFFIQLGHLLVRMLRNPGHDLGEFRLVEMREDEAPFSFWNRIFLNPDRYDPDTFHQIVQHEQIHVRQRHSFDLLLAEAVVVLQWFNPFAWWYRRAIEHNLEYLTDAEMLRGGNDPETYQLSLVRVAIPNFPNGLVASYNQSFLEKRITMMKTRKSSLRSGWKYLTILPLLLLSVLQFNAVAQVAPAPPQPPAVAAPTVPITPPVVSVPVPAVTPGANRPIGEGPFPQAVPSPAPVPAPATAVPLSPANVPVPLPTPVSVPLPTPAPVPGMMPVIPATAAGEINSWTALIEGPEICFQFMSRSNAFNNRYNYQNSRCFALRDFGDLPRGNMGEFRLERTAGTMTFKGVFDGDDGVGNFDFKPAAAFASYLSDAGFGRYDDREVMLFFMADMDEDYIEFVRSQGYNPDHGKLIELAIFYDDLDELKTRIAELDRAGYDKPSLSKLIQLQIHGVSADYARELADSGFKDLSIDDLIEARIHGVSAEFLGSLARAGLSGLSFDRAKEMAIHGIDAEYVEEMSQLGYKNLQARELVNAKIHGINAGKIAGLRRAGFSNLSIDEAKNLSIHGVDADFVRALADFGFRDLTPQQATDAKIHGLSARKLAELKSTGLPINNLDEVKNASIHGVSAEYIAGMRAIGYKEMTMRDFVQAKIHGVTPEWAASFREVGFKDIPLDTLMQLRIHGVDARFIKDRMKEGRTLKDYVKMKIHGL